MEQYDFIFSLHLMKTVLGITNELSQALQRKDQDIVNAIKLVQISKDRLQMMRVSGWETLLEEITSFCVKHNQNVPNMNEDYLVAGRSKRGGKEISNLEHYRYGLFNTVLDRQLQELNNRFSEANTDLLICMTCLTPDDSFASYDKKKLIHLAELYPNDFSELNREAFLGDQLETYILDVRSSGEFLGLKGLGSLAQKMAETKKSVVYPLVYRLIKLALVLPVATASVERVFSAMNIVKNRLRNRMGNQFLSDSLVVYVEKKIFKSISNDAIMECFQSMKTRREQLY